MSTKSLDVEALLQALRDHGWSETGPDHDPVQWIHGKFSDYEEDYAELESDFKELEAELEKSEGNSESMRSKLREAEQDLDDAITALSRARDTYRTRWPV